MKGFFHFELDINNDKNIPVRVNISDRALVEKGLTKATMTLISDGRLQEALLCAEKPPLHRV